MHITLLKIIKLICNSVIKDTALQDFLPSLQVEHISSSGVFISGYSSLLETSVFHLFVAVSSLPSPSDALGTAWKSVTSSRVWKSHLSAAIAIKDAKNSKEAEKVPLVLYLETKNQF